MVATLRPLNSSPQTHTYLALDRIYIILPSTGVSKVASFSHVLQLETSTQYTDLNL
jgi:hypothetical protein